MERSDAQHFAWLGRSFGRTDYLLLSPDDLEAIAAIGRYVRKYPGTHLFRQGEEARSAYVVHSGEVELYRGDHAEGRMIVRVDEGAVLGDIAMFRGGPYLSSARAANRVTALELDRSQLLPLLVERPIIALRWLVAGLDQLERTQRRVLRLMHRTVLQQVADLLLDEADDRGEIRLSQETIATLLGTTRQSVNEALGELRDAGAVETGYRRITLVAADRAAKLAGRTA
ncbi:MAG: Crp/Fnr family transcriptional regulator [Acidimicrobiia bacterium]|nr:Crp/Fnr family transcriptional regulator [Acidimicrobiia bacterium]